MGILTTQDKEKVKRAVPKASNKIIDATVARLYIAYPDRTKWTFTGLMGAIALVDDLVGHTFFLKLVDITGARGVLWDQELYVDFQYHQDRTFFHTFEIEDCLVGLLFEDTHDAAHFYKRVTTRHKHALKQTANNKNAIALKDRLGPEEVKKGMRGEFVDVTTGQRSRRARGVLYYDDQPPVEWRLLYNELAAAGITEDMIAENRQFIKDYIAQQGGPLVGLEPPIPRRFSGAGAAPSRTASISTSHSNTNSGPAPSVPPKKTKKAPPPPPPGAGSNTSAAPPSVASPTPPPSYSNEELGPVSDSDDDGDQGSDHTEAESKPRFRVPPINAPVPKVSNSAAPASSPVPHSSFASQQPVLQNQFTTTTPQTAMSAPPLSQLKTGLRPGPPPPPRAARPGPPPPPRASGSVPGANAANTTSNSGPYTGAPPPPPPPRATGNAPPPPPSRASRPVPTTHVAPQNPALQQQVPIPAQHTQPPLPPQRNYSAAPIPSQTATPAPPPLPPVSSVPAPQLLASAPPPPPPPPLPPIGTTQQNAGNTSAPPPLPPVATGGPPPPPPPPTMGAESMETAPLPAVDSSRGALLASIENSGIGMLRKTDKSKLEKPSVLLQEARGEPVASPPTGGAAAGGAVGQPETLADALASALNKRKGKVAVSDDDDDDEDW